MAFNSFVLKLWGLFIIIIIIFLWHFLFWLHLKLIFLIGPRQENVIKMQNIHGQSVFKV